MKSNPVVRLSDWSVRLAMLLIFAMMLHVSIDVASKYLLNHPLPGTLEVVSAYYMVAGVFLPIAMVEIARGAIVVDVAYQYMPAPMKAFCIFLALLGSAALYAILAWTSWGDAMRSLAVREVVMGTVRVSVWPSRFILPFSFALAGVVCIWQMYRFATSAVIRAAMIDAGDPREEV